MSQAAHPDAVASGIIEAGTLQQFVDTCRAIVHEAKVHFGDHGVRVSAVEPANVAMYAPVELAPRAFESFETPGTAVVGINLDRLDEVLSPTNSDDLVEFAVDMETRTLDIHYRTVAHSIALIDPDAIRDEPDGAGDFDLPNHITLEGRQLDDAVTACDMVSDHLAIQCDPDAREARITADGDTDTTVVTFDDETLIDARVDTDSESLFSIGYFEDIVAPMPADAAVELRAGDDFPAKLAYHACDGALSVEAMVAPRIQNN